MRKIKEYQQQSFIDVLQNFSCSQKFCNIYRKTPVLEYLFNKLVSQESCNFIKERLQHRYFLWIYEIFKSIFLIEHFQWLVPENDFLNILQNTVSRILIYIFKFVVGFFPLRGGENERTFLINPFNALASFDTPWKHEKILGFLMLSGGIERDQWHEIS